MINDNLLTSIVVDNIEENVRAEIVPIKHQELYL